MLELLYDNGYEFSIINRCSYNKNDKCLHNHLSLEFGRDSGYIDFYPGDSLGEILAEFFRGNFGEN